jgi:hypothetical protein
MNFPLKTFRITQSLIVAVSITALICVCAKQPTGIARNNLYDPGGSNWHPPMVTAMNDTIVKPNDSITITATGTDNGTVVKYVWAKNGTIYSDTTDTGFLKAAWPDTGRKVVRVKAIDNDGVPSLPDSCVVTVMLDLLVPNAGQDTTVSIKDTVRLHGSATDRFGYITSWAWDIGNTGTFVTKSKGDTTIVAPSSENLNYLCVLRVTDDDGNVAKDTVRIVVCNIVQGSPIAEYLFNGNANDYSGNNLNGIVYGATSVNDRHGNSNGAYSFNGSSDYIQATHQPVLDMDSSLTIITWIFISGYYSQWERIVGKANAYNSDDDWLLGISQHGGIYFSIWSGGGQYYVNGTTPIPLNQWTQIAGTWDGDTMRTYINGVLQPEKVALHTLIDQSTGSLIIGKDPNSTYYFRGDIDEIEIYSKALSSDEINSCYLQSQ